MAEVFGNCASALGVRAIESEGGVTHSGLVVDLGPVQRLFRQFGAECINPV